MTDFIHRRADFPQDFQFGVATSAYQIEGHGFGGAGRTHWDDFAATPGNVVRAEHGQRACDHYHRWEEDLDLIAAAGFDIYRFSASWARVLPDGRGAVNTEGLDYYDRLVDGMLERGIKPALTLYHWELPSALADLGGWRNRDVADWFADYTDILCRRIGDRIWSAAPINEPWCVGWLSHFMGAHAPGLRDIRATARAMHHIGLAHGRATQVMRGLGMSNLGAVCNFEYALPLTDSDADRASAKLYDGIYNRWFLGGMFKGQYPADVLEGLEPHMPKGWQEDMAAIRQPLDWLGLNYYTCKRIAHDGAAAWPHLSEHVGALPKTQMGWEICPDGLAHFLHFVGEYAGNLPLYVTENGMANPDSPDQPDDARIAYLNAHLDAARDAMAKGANLKGYIIWSLLDNYEWSLGYEKRFGLVHVDFESLQRRPKASYQALQQALART
ncbi:Beta-glucosidase A [Roseibaca ekhonensis]|uniref:Beta-glucosidase n=1 Tax=Roseinatronobacter ekhonensis TaxID=254356 RepID=A0A3B0M9P4_9RHOB|nr:GH1 family beta-glucosidase [Roseibaca ekhonensis]SUZ32100.1 Beta-glucosidase A [Roseibaca ekhonensis]